MRFIVAPFGSRHCPDCGEKLAPHTSHAGTCRWMFVGDGAPTPGRLSGVETAPGHAHERDLTPDEVKEILRLGWDDHMADFTDFSEGEMSLLLRWCGMEDRDPYGPDRDWTIRAPKRLVPPSEETA